MNGNNGFRQERDSMGAFEVPLEAYYGANTMRAVRNFPISQLRFPRSFIRAMGLIKGAAAAVNQKNGDLDAALAPAIMQAAGEVTEGTLDSEFVVDIFQTGSGTSTNMNANEVISNRAIEILGGEKGSRTPVHPNDHVNMGQSSNDVIPTAIHISAAILIHEQLLPALQELESALREKSQQFWGVIKTGRTHLQDATPIRLGQEFLGWAGQMERARNRAQAAATQLQEVALGGTAVGTGIGCDPHFAAAVLAEISSQLGIAFRESDNHFQAQGSLDNAVAAGGEIKAIAVALFKIANDIRLLSCGPRAGIAELELPPVQPGSSIMPGKVNPVICESVTMVTARVLGNDATIAFAGAAGSLLELNVMMPIVAFCLLESIEIVASSARNLARQCVAGIEATERGPALLEQGLMTCTALAPKIGYDAAAAIAKEAFLSGKTVRQVAREKTNLSEDELTDLLDPETMTQPGRGGAAGG